MTQAVTEKALQFLVSHYGRKVIGNILKDDNFARNMLRGFGAKSVKDKDVDDIRNMAKNLDPNKSIEENNKHIKEILSEQPNDILQSTLATTSSELFGYLGKRGANNANALATALLAAGHSETPEQEARYGKTVRSRVADAQQAAAMRDGNNTRDMYNAGKNVVDKVYGDYERKREQMKAMLVAQYLNRDNNMSAAEFNYYDGIRKSTDKNRNGSKK